MIKFVSDLRQVAGFLRVLRFPSPIKLITNWYNWNIVESGTKHYNHITPKRFRETAMWNLFFNWKYTIVGFTTTYAIAVYHHLSCEFKSWWGVLDTTLCNNKWTVLHLAWAGFEHIRFSKILLLKCNHIK
jgi:hypothetical protein